MNLLIQVHCPKEIFGIEKITTETVITILLNNIDTLKNGLLILVMISYVHLSMNGWQKKKKRIL